ncbi:hypothetical protein FPSE_03782 [Fusarium pseudograminearum CS3096]|uniref:Heme haloperoxidase family profile domain-containing protein n=1 Tax=Fusarium pseudograminearum (strain CS3096) TaxID=1028729 RepID=K3W1J5_FUSPC|nr:hypothetical protein FPSE_03782 [Fusarium pseudograminearum CS3096]EKJ76010.1 hypothetical protein FPSE_03782 [Fusarium pseudograminearum CS3096]
MKFSTLIAASGAVAPALALPQFLPTAGAEWTPQEWVAPGANDSRGPCPGLNTLANHGYLPHDGKNIDLKKLADGMLAGFNIEKGDALLLFTQAIRTSPDYPATRTFDLADLGRHNILEHDISISRSDAFFADPNPFNKTVWAETLTYFPDDMITVEQVAKARMGRLATSKKTNPQHSLSKLADGFSWGEMASFFEIMADGTTGTVEKKYIEYWFKNERLPTEIGWQRRTTTMRGIERIEFTRKLMEAAGVSRRDITSDAYGRPLEQ